MTMRTTSWTRLTIGLLQGVVLLLLYQAFEQKAWPATDGLVFAPLLTIAVFIPTIVISGLGDLRLGTLVKWTAIATILCTGLAVYDIFRDPIVLAGPAQRLVPSWIMWWSLAAILFIVHTLTVSGEADRKLTASYPTHFDVAWKHGVQFVLAVCFVGLLWALLFLGSELFRLIKIEFVADLIKRKTFAIPVTAFAFSYAIHITDVRANIVQGARSLCLILLSWLLPLMVLMGAAFIIALPFTGLEPLWNTRRASSILLTAAGSLVFLINAAYQDGRPENRASAALRYAVPPAALVLVPLIALVGYALKLRITQYGWTPDRIDALACVVVAACYGLGYVVAFMRWGLSMKGLEGANLVTSLVIVAVLLVLRTPIADPARISVADQIRRLGTGQVAPEKFDFAFLRFGAGRYGAAALEQLAADTEGPQASIVAERAGRVLQAKNPWDVGRLASTPAQRAIRINVISPRGGALPEDFLRQDWNAFQPRYKLPLCLVSDAQCEAIIVDLDGDGQPEVLIFNLTTSVGAAVFKKRASDGNWTYFAAISNTYCSGVREALRAGQFEVVQPSLKEIDVNGQRLRITTECAPVQGGQ
jgi:hypothetical protein